MYRVELIPKQSTNLDIIGPWTDSGREDNTADGQYVFEFADSCFVSHGTIMVAEGDKTYWYNLADFYRVKAVKLQ